MKENKKNKTWHDAEKEIAEKINKPTTEHLAMEVLKQEQRRRKWQTAGLSIGMVLLATVAITTVVTGQTERENLVKMNYQNDCDWRKMFSDYDFVSQDGEGINNVNRGDQGDLNNGAESQTEKEQ